MPVLLEENDWASHYLISQIAAIIINEHLGYKAKFNVPDPSALARAFDRTAIPGERLKKSDLADWVKGDGDQLKKVLASGKHFVYINMEVWSGTKMATLAKFVEQRGTARNVGGVGYMGRDGWYVPRWIVDRCGALAYPSWLPGMDGVVRQVYNHSGQLKHPVHATEEKCFGDDKACTLWFPNKNSTREHIIVHIVLGYGGKTNHDMVTYNNMHVALQSWSYANHLNYVNGMLDAVEKNPFCGGQGTGVEPAARAVAFYHWEPSNAFTSVQWNGLERLMMPARDCDLNPRCDFPPNRLLKVSSTQYELEAPLLDQLLTTMTLSRSDIDKLLYELDQKGGSSDAIFDVACGWVKDNEDTWEDWTIDRHVPVHVPFYAYAWNPQVFFSTFIAIVVGMIIWCLGFESSFITGHPFRAKSGYKLGLVPACSLAKVLEKKKPPETWQEFQAKQAVGSIGSSVVIFAAPVFYDDPAVDPTNIQIALLRLGRCDEEAAICIETCDYTALAGVNYRAVKCKVTFGPGEQIKWLNIPRIQAVEWMTETFLKVIITTVIKGEMALGGLSQCTVVVTDRRLYPGLQEAAPLHTMRGRFIFLRGLTKQFLFTHGKTDELKRMAWICYDAVFAVIVRTLLYNDWLLGIVVGERMYEGLFLVLGLEAADQVLGRFSQWRQKITGTGDLRKQVHHHTVQKLVLPFTHNSATNLDALFVSSHLCAIDQGINSIYSSLYALYKSILVIGLSAGYILTTGAATGHYLLLVYRFVPMIIMLPLCFFFGFGWKKAWRWSLQMQHERTLQTRVNMAMWLMKVRTTMKVYNTGFLSTKYGESFATALNAEFRDAKLEGLHDFDSNFLSSSFADFVILGLYLTLVLVHMESRTYGAGGFTLYSLLATIRVYTMLKGAILGICINCRNIEDGIACINSARCMLDMESKVDSLREQLQQRLQRFHMEPHSKVAPRLPTKMSCTFMSCVVEVEGNTFTFDGSVPLGETYLMDSHASKAEQEMFINVFQGLVQIKNGCVDMPSWIRCIALFGEKMPELFHVSAIENALVFADRRKYGETEARAMLRFFQCFTENHGDADGGDPLSKVLDPNDLSFESSFLLAVIQVILADPEVVLFDKPLVMLHVRRHRLVLQALVSWQRGGPQAVLQAAYAKAYERQNGNAEWSKLASNFPEWFEPTGSVRRTLILNTHGAPAIFHVADTIQDFHPHQLGLTDGAIFVKHNKAHLCKDWGRMAQTLLNKMQTRAPGELCTTDLVGQEGRSHHEHVSKIEPHSTNKAQPDTDQLSDSNHKTASVGLRDALTRMDASKEQLPPGTKINDGEPSSPVLNAKVTLEDIEVRLKALERAERSESRLTASNGASPVKEGENGRKSETQVQGEEQKHMLHDTTNGELDSAHNKCVLSLVNLDFKRKVARGKPLKQDNQ